MSWKSDSIVAASFNAGMTMAAFIMTVAVKEFYELTTGANRLGPSVGIMPDKRLVHLSSYQRSVCMKLESVTPGALSADKGV